MKFAHAALTAASSRTLQPSFIVRATPQKRQNNSPQGSKTRSTAVFTPSESNRSEGQKKQSHRRTGAAVFYVKNGRAKNTLILTSRPSKRPSNPPLKSGVFGDFLPYNPPEKVWQYNFMPKTFQAPYRAFLNKKHF